MAFKIIIPTLPDTKTVEELRLAVTNAFGSIQAQLEVAPIVGTTNIVQHKQPIRKSTNTSSVGTVATFVFGVNGTCTTSDNTNECIYNSAGNFIIWKAKAKIAPVGGSWKADILKNGTSILGTNLVTIPSGSLSVQTGTIFSVGSYVNNDYISSVITAIGTTTSGGQITVELFGS